MRAYGVVLLTILVVLISYIATVRGNALAECNKHYAILYRAMEVEAKRKPFVKVDKDRRGDLYIQIDEHIFRVQGVCSIRT